MAVASAAAQTAPAPVPAEAAPPEPALVETTAPEPKPEKAQGGHTESLVSGDPWSDEAAGVKLGPISLRTLIQARYGHTFIAHSQNPRAGYAVRENILARDNDGWRLQRLFVRLAANPSPYFGFKAILDFAKLTGDTSDVLKQAYMTLKPLPQRVEIAAGLLKLPFSTLELDAIADYELADLGAADTLIKDLGFGGRDLGAEVVVAPLPRPQWLRFSAGAFRGHAKDEHASPLGALGGRVEAKPFKGFRVGADVVAMPFRATYKRPFETSSKDELPAPPDPLYPREQRFASGKAYSADLTFERWRLMLRGEGILGDRVDVDTRYGARSFYAVWGLVGYRFHAGPVQLMPAARAEWLDTDREHSVGLRRELSLGLNVLFKKHVRLLLDYTNTVVQAGSPVLEQPQPIPAFPYFDIDHQHLVAQLQGEF
jgi:hypothetical protein